MDARRQVSIIPFRRDAAGRIEVLMITSRETRRWIVPKGWPWPDLPDHLAAAEEAREEAGVTGRTDAESIGHYSYVKRKRTALIDVVVDVYLLEVETELATWPEQAQRERRWFRPAVAAALVSEPGLVGLIAGLDPSPVT